MKESIKFQILDSARRLRNAKKKAEEINSKIDNLQKELTVLEKKFNQELEFVVSIGMKEPSREQGKPDTEKELQAKREYNRTLVSEKKDFLSTEELEEVFFGQERNPSSFDEAMAKLGLRF